MNPLDPKWNELHFAKGNAPRHDKIELSSYSLCVIYAYVRRAEYLGLSLVDDKPRFEYTIADLLGKPRTAVPRVATNFENLDDPITKKVAKVAEKYLDELFRYIERISDEYDAKEKEIEDADQREREEKKRLGQERRERERQEKKRLGQERRERERQEKEHRKRERKGPTTSRPSISAPVSDSAPMVTANPYQDLAPTGAPIPPGWTNVGSAYGLADLRPVTRGLDTISYPPPQLPTHRSRPAQYQPPIPPDYTNVDSTYSPADTQPVARGLGTISHPSSQLSTHRSRSAQYEIPIPPGYTSVGSAYGPPDTQSVAEGLGTIGHPPSQFPFREDGYDAILGQVSNSPESQHTGLYGQQKTVNKESSASSNRGMSIFTSSSGRSASPTRAGTTRQQEDEKARRKTAKDDSKKKADEGDGKKARDSRQKKADKAKDKAKKSHRSRPQ